MEQQATNIRADKQDSKYPHHNITDFLFFYNTPLTDFQNTIHFPSNEARNDYFLKGKHFETFSDFKSGFNFIRDRGEVNIPISWRNAQGINYCTFISDFEDRRYYAFVVGYEYINDSVTKFQLMIDTVMTFTQGNVLEQIPNVNIDRQHLTEETYQKQLPYLRNNDDVIKATNKYYVAGFYQDFGENYVLFQSSADLSKEFGDKKEPNLDSSKGTTYDHITSPVDLYIIDYNDFNKFMNTMSKYPWITQNFQQIQLIPKMFIDENDLAQIDAEEKVGAKLYTLTKGKISKRWTVDNLEVSFKDLAGYMGVDYQKDPHLVRDEYLTVELYDYNGENMFLNAGDIPIDVGTKFNTRSIIGYHNEVRVYPVHYKSMDIEEPVRRQSDSKILIDKGAFLNESMSLDTFAQVPILIDNGTLQQANQANKRQLQRDRLMKNRMKSVFSGESSGREKFYDATNLLQNLNPYQFFSKFQDDYEKMRDQKAEDRDLALQPPQVTASEMGNAFLIANDINGLTMKLGCPMLDEMENIKNYYYYFGFETGDYSTYIEPIDSMSVCNYLKINESRFELPDIDINLVNMLKGLLETGVRFWHNDGTANPMAQDIKTQERVK